MCVQTVHRTCRSHTFHGMGINGRWYVCSPASSPATHDRNIIICRPCEWMCLLLKRWKWSPIIYWTTVRIVVAAKKRARARAVFYFIYVLILNSMERYMELSWWQCDKQMNYYYCFVRIRCQKHMESKTSTTTTTKKRRKYFHMTKF